MKTIDHCILLLLITASTLCAQTESRPRARDLGIEVGVLPAGPLNAITDVVGVKVGQTTIIRGDNIHRGYGDLAARGESLSGTGSGGRFPG
jgi:D-aminopeptidase